MARSSRIKAADGSANLVGPIIKEQRQTLGWSLEDLCQRISQVTRGEWTPNRRDMHKVEAQLRGVSDLELLALFRALGCSTDTFFGSVNPWPQSSKSGS